MWGITNLLAWLCAWEDNLADPHGSTVISHKRQGGDLRQTAWLYKGQIMPDHSGDLLWWSDCNSQHLTTSAVWCTARQYCEWASRQLDPDLNSAVWFWTLLLCGSPSHGVYRAEDNSSSIQKLNTVCLGPVINFLDHLCLTWKQQYSGSTIVFQWFW